MSPNGELAAAVALSGDAKVFRVSDGAVVTELKTPCLPYPGIVFVRDDSVLLTSCTSLDIYDVPTGQLRRSYTGPTTMKRSRWR
jgi:hypothetical protein